MTSTWEDSSTPPVHLTGRGTAVLLVLIALVLLLAAHIGLTEQRQRCDAQPTTCSQTLPETGDRQ